VHDAAVAASDPRAIEALVTAHLALVSMVARQVQREIGVASRFTDELEAAGREGLFMAAQRFEPERGVPFRRFANHRVRGAIIDALRRESLLPRKTRAKLHQMETALVLNEDASENLAAPRAPGSGVTDLDARLASHLANLATALATGLIAQGATEDGAPIAVDAAPTPEECVAFAEQRASLNAAIEELTEQEKTLIKKHYFEEVRFDEVAVGLKMSKSWASRLHTRAIGKLTKKFAGHGA
jgi:RNA polymerase sigma factor for flagellar operon FliA